MDGHDVRRVAFCAAWVIFGALYLTAWNFQFPTEIEKIMWRVASLVLTGGSLVAIVVVCFTSHLRAAGGVVQEESNGGSEDSPVLCISFRYRISGAPHGVAAFQPS